MMLCLTIVYAVWSSTYVVSSIGVHALPPFLFGGVRFMVGGLLLYSVAWALGHRAPVTAVQWRRIMLVAIGGVLISNGCNSWALQTVASNRTALLNVSSALLIPLLGMFGARAHRLTARVALGLIIGFAGEVLILWPESGVAAKSTSGWPELLVLLGCLGWAFATIYQRNTSGQMNLLAFTGLYMFCGGVMLFSIALLRGDQAHWNWSLAGTGALAYMIIFSSCIAYTAYGWLTQHATPALVGSFAFVTPAIATALGWLVLDEHLTALQTVGMLIVLAGVVLVTRTGAAEVSEAPG